MCDEEEKQLEGKSKQQERMSDDTTRSSVTWVTHAERVTRGPRVASKRSVRCSRAKRREGRRGRVKQEGSEEMRAKRELTKSETRRSRRT